MEQHYDFSQIPSNWRYCFNSECPMCGECLRYQTGRQLPDDHECGHAVFPPALKDGSCRFFRKNEKVRLATGFLTGDKVLNNMFVALRHRLTAYLGGNGTYYLYRNGKRWLSPEQQNVIRQIFRDAGYQGDVRFAQYKDDYYFI